MIRVASESDFLQLFRSIDREEVQLPSDVLFPLAISEYMTWVEPSGHRVYLVYEDPTGKGPYGVVFRRGHGVADPIPQMCEWCHSVRGGNRVGLLTATVSPKRRIGAYLCRNLDCREHIASGPSVNDMRESVDHNEKLRRIVRRMADFTRKNLF